MTTDLVDRFQEEWRATPIVADEAFALALASRAAGRALDSFDAVRHDADLPGSFFVYEPEGTAFRVSETRVLRDHAVALSGADARAYFFVLRADALTIEAANSLLKVLEDVPSGVFFVLVTERPDALLPTVRSRCFFARSSEGSVSMAESELAGAVDAYVSGSPAALLFALSEKETKIERDEAVAILHRTVAALRRPDRTFPDGLPERAAEGLALLRSTTVSPRNVLDFVFLA